MNEETRPKEQDLMKYIGATFLFASFVVIAVVLMGLCMEIMELKVAAVLLAVSALTGWVSAECLDFLESKNE